MSNPKRELVTPDPGLGKEGVTDSPFDLHVDKATYERVRQADMPSDVPTPTSPNDDSNTRRSKTANMNAHIPQAVPPDY